MSRLSLFFSFKIIVKSFFFNGKDDNNSVNEIEKRCLDMIIRNVVSLFQTCSSRHLIDKQTEQKSGNFLSNIFIENIYIQYICLCAKHQHRMVERSREVKKK